MKFSRKRKSKFAQAVKRKQAKIDRTAGEKFSLTRAYKSSGNRSTVLIERSVYAGTLTQTDGTTVAQIFKLSDLPNYTDFTNLYDQYRIVGIKVQVVNNMPANATVWNSTLGTPASYFPGTVVTCIDLDDGNTPTVNEVLEHESALVHGNGRKYSREFIPAIAQSAYQGAFTGYTSRQNQWIDSNSPGVEHYGFKLGVKNAGTPPTGAFLQLFYTYIIEFRMPN